LHTLQRPSSDVCAAQHHHRGRFACRLACAPCVSSPLDGARWLERHQSPQGRYPAGEEARVAMRCRGQGHGRGRGDQPCLDDWACPSGQRIGAAVVLHAHPHDPTNAAGVAVAAHPSWAQPAGAADAADRRAQRKRRRFPRAGVLSCCCCFCGGGGLRCDHGSAETHHCHRRLRRGARHGCHRHCCDAPQVSSCGWRERWQTSRRRGFLVLRQRSIHAPIAPAGLHPPTLLRWYPPPPPPPMLLLRPHLLTHCLHERWLRGHSQPLGQRAVVARPWHARRSQRMAQVSPPSPTRPRCSGPGARSPSTAPLEQPLPRWR
jgi:hypothetical protein